jgi:purine-binding chemotaxis protein CheW
MSTTDSENRYLIFRIGGEHFACPLLSVREVLEYQKPKHMPNMVHYFPGVINVRGSIVGVVDLRTKFGASAAVEPRTAMLLCDTDRGALAAIVDRVESVRQIPPEKIDHDPSLVSKIDARYLLGVATTDDGLITVVDLHQSIIEEQLKTA